MPVEDSELDIYTEELTPKSPPQEVIERVNRAVSALKGAKGHSQAIADLQEAVRGLQSARGSAPELSGPERALAGRYLRADGNGAVKPLLTRSALKIGRRSYEVFGLLDDPRADVPEVQRELQEWAETRTLIRSIYRGAGKQPATPICDAEIMRLAQQLPGDLKRAFVDSAGAGGEFIPDVTLPEIIRRAEWMRRMSALFPSHPLSGANDIVPRLDSGAIPYLIAEPTDDDTPDIPASSVVTASNGFAPKTIAARVRIASNAEEDSLIAIMPMVRQELVEALVAAKEDAIYNGDTTATHQDTIAAWNPNNYWGANFLAGAGGTNDHRRQCIGLRARAADVSNTVDRSTLTFATLLADQAQLVGQPGPNGTALICSATAIGVIGALSQFSTLDVAGPNAANMNGLAVGSILGCPVVLSEFATSDLNASGVFDNTTTTKGAATFVRTGRFGNHSRRAAMIESAKEIKSQMTDLVITERYLFAARSKSDEKNVRYMYNIA